MDNNNEHGERVFSRRRGDLDLSQARANGTLPEKLVEQAARKIAIAGEAGKIDVLKRAADALERIAVGIESAMEMLAVARASNLAKPTSKRSRPEEG